MDFEKIEKLNDYEVLDLYNGLIEQDESIYMTQYMKLKATYCQKGSTGTAMASDGGAWSCVYDRFYTNGRCNSWYLGHYGYVFGKANTNLCSGFTTSAYVCVVDCRD